MASGNALCSMCRKRTAAMFCTCSLPETFLCAKCVGPHNVKQTGHPHTTWPMDQLAHYQAPGYSQQIQKRLEHFSQVRAQMLAQVSAVDGAIQEFSEVMNRAIEELVNYRDKTVEGLRGVRDELSGEVEAALEEVERTLVDDRPRLTTRYGDMVRALTEEMHPFELFTYSLSPTPPPFEVLHYQLRSFQHSSDQFAALSGKNLVIFDLKTQKTSHHTLTEDPGYPGYIALDRRTLMLIGRQVMTLDLVTFQTTALPNLIISRYYVGVAKVGTVVFALGGVEYGEELAVCEKWNMQCWSRLPDMHYARGYFTPCHFQSLIYLAASANHRVVESFSPLTETFTVLPVSLPSHLTLSCSSVAFIVSGELCLLTSGKQMARWVIESGKGFGLRAIEKSCYSFQQPLIVGTEVFIALDGEVVKWSSKTYKFV